MIGLRTEPPSISGSVFVIRNVHRYYRKGVLFLLQSTIFEGKEPFVVDANCEPNPMYWNRDLQLLRCLLQALTSQRGGSLGASGAVIAILGLFGTASPDSRLQIIFLPMFTFTAATGIKAMVRLWQDTLTYVGYVWN